MSGRANFLLLAAACMTCWSSAVAQSSGSCEHGIASQVLDVGNVRASMYTNGNLFWQGNESVYEVPKGSGLSPLFAVSILLGGYVDGELRVAAATYTNYKFWPGPISDDGSAPAECAEYDRIWKVSIADVERFEKEGDASTDLIEWPTGLGAPTVSATNRDGSATISDGIDNDNDGLIDEPGELRSITDEVLQQPLSQRRLRRINLAAGERPDLLGDQMLWWVMNDVGNVHTFSDGRTTETVAPLGVEVHASAFAFGALGELGNTTFYRFRMFRKGDTPVTDAFVGLYVDSDLGYALDDYVGSDSTLGLGIVYNADDDDDITRGGYGPAPPAVGVDFLRGPVVPSPRDTAQTFGGSVPDSRNLSMTSFIRFFSGASGIPNTDPRLSVEYYRYVQGLWKNGLPMRVGGDGYNTTATETTKFMYPAEPGPFWSEFNTGSNQPDSPWDRRFISGSGPFEIAAGASQELLLGIVWARGASNLDSYYRLKTVDRKVQRFADSGFYRPAPPDPPIVTTSEFDGAVTLTWRNADDSNNALDTYREYTPFGDLANPFYEFEGYEVWEFDTAHSVWPACVDSRTCQLLQVFDRPNGVTVVRGDEDGDLLNEVYASGSDSGIRHALTLDGLVNYRSYHFGVRAYAYNSDAVPTIFRSSFSRLEAVPTRTSNPVSPEAVAAAIDSSDYDLVADFEGIGDGFVGANVVDPAAIRDCSYRVEFYQPAPNVTTYDIYCDTEKVLNGPQSGAVFGGTLSVIDGLELSIEQSEAGIRNFTVVANASGTLNPPDMGTLAFNSNGYPTFEGSDRPTRGYQQSTNDSAWGIQHGGGSDATWESFLVRVLRNDNLERVGIHDYEMRWTSAGGKARREYDDGVDINVPFELWRTGIDTPDDPSDDVRMIPYICEEACGAGAIANQWDVSGDSPVSGGDDDPASDWVYWYLPEDQSPGQAGYDAWLAGTGGEAGELFARTILVNWNGGAAPPYNADQPEVGTVFRIETLKPFQPGDEFTFSTSGLAPTPLTQTQQVARLDEIGIVPNPYRGRSQYETSTLKDEVRFTNLPDEAIIRVFTLSGRLVRTINKSIPGQEWLAWDVRTDAGRPLASGIYLVHVEVPGVGTHVIKFGFVGKRWGD